MFVTMLNDLNGTYWTWKTSIFHSGADHIQDQTWSFSVKPKLERSLPNHEMIGLILWALPISWRTPEKGMLLKPPVKQWMGFPTLPTIIATRASLELANSAVVCCSELVCCTLEGVCVGVNCDVHWKHIHRYRHICTHMHVYTHSTYIKATHIRT